MRVSNRDTFFSSLIKICIQKQLEELQARIQETEANLSDSDDDIKREPSPIHVPPPDKEGHVFIDLTL